jgi:hypothetical protein
MTLGLSQPLTEMSARNLSGSKGWPVRKADNLTPPEVSQLAKKMWEPQHLKTLWANMACYRDSFIFFLPYQMLE